MSNTETITRTVYRCALDPDGFATESLWDLGYHLVTEHRAGHIIPGHMSDAQLAAFSWLAERQSAVQLASEHETGAHYHHQDGCPRCPQEAT